MLKSNKLFICILTIIFVGFAAFLVGFQLLQNEFSLYIVIKSDSGEETVDCWKNEDDEYYFFVPSYTELSQVYIYSNSADNIDINGNKLTGEMNCGAFEFDTPYSITYKSFFNKKTKSIIFLQSSNIASMYIDTKSGEMDYIHATKGNEETGTVRLYNVDGSVNYNGSLAYIRGRGNTSWDNYDKKPYNIKLSDAADLLKMGSAEKWCLLANASDSSNIKNKVVFDFAKKAGLEYTPDSEWVDLYLNGEYVGVYLLCEQIEIHSERVSISEDESFIVSLEKEGRLISNNYPYILTENKQALRIHHSALETEVLSEKWQSIENAILSEDGIDPDTGKSWNELIDVDSWAKKYLIEEIFANIDACYISQFYYYDSSISEKVYAGPVWDYDLSMGDSSIESNPKVFYANRLIVKNGVYSPWYYYLYQNEAFYERIVEIYEEEFVPLLDELLNSSLQLYTQNISQASYMNYVRWNDICEDFDLQVSNIETYMSGRVEFFNSVWIDDVDYCLVSVNSDRDANIAYYAVETGNCLTELPDYKDNEAKFLGWYYADTNKPFDYNSPIYHDTAIVGKWMIPAWISYIDEIISLALITIIFCIILSIEVNRIRKRRKL